MHQKIIAIFKTMLNTQAELNTTMGGDGWLASTLSDNNGFNYRRAILVEASEAIAHTNYKWWVKGDTNYQQYKMELIDIAHFLLSFTHVVERSAKPFYWVDRQPGVEYTPMDAMVEAWNDAMQRYTIDNVQSNAPESSVAAIEISIRHLESLITNLYGRHIVCQETYTTYDLGGAWTSLFGAIKSVWPNYTIDDLMVDYLSKSLLNRFRTMNGAKQYGIALTEADLISVPKAYLKVWNDGREDVEHLSEILSRLIAEGGTITASTILESLEKAYKQYHYITFA